MPKKRQLNKKGVKQYLANALGEIILIVLGVLIAIGINNYYQKKADNKQLEGIRELIRSDFQKDQQLIREVKEHYRIREKHFQDFRSSKMSAEMLTECSECHYLISGYRLFRPNQKGYTALQYHINNKGINKDDKLVEFLQSYQQSLEVLGLAEQNIIADVNSNLIQWRDQYSWFGDFVQEQAQTGFGEYQINTWEFTNKVNYHYVMIYENYLPLLTEYEQIMQTYLEQ